MLNAPAVRAEQSQPAAPWPFHADHDVSLAFLRERGGPRKCDMLLTCRFRMCPAYMYAAVTYCRRIG